MVAVVEFLSVFGVINMNGCGFLTCPSLKEVTWKVGLLSYQGTESINF